jgi:hypothetical protein
LCMGLDEFITPVRQRLDEVRVICRNVSAPELSVGGRICKALGGTTGAPQVHACNHLASYPIIEYRGLELRLSRASAAEVDESTSSTSSFLGGAFARITTSAREFKPFS